MKIPDPRINLISTLGTAQLERITRKIIRQLKRTVAGDKFLDGLQEYDLKNAWEGYCVQIQGEQWTIWRFFLDYVEQIVQDEMKSLSPEVIDILWLISDQGLDWQYDLENADDDEDSMDKYEQIPRSDDDVMNKIVSSLNHAAANYSNSRIERYGS